MRNALFLAVLLSSSPLYAIDIVFNGSNTPSNWNYDGSPYNCIWTNDGSGSFNIPGATSVVVTEYCMADPQCSLTEPGVVSCNNSYSGGIRSLSYQISDSDGDSGNGDSGNGSGNTGGGNGDTGNTGGGVSGEPDNSSSYYVRFLGGTAVDGDLGRIKIMVDEISNGDTSPPWDLGSTDYTVEMWLYSEINQASSSSYCGAYNWIYGSAFYDRDIFGDSVGHGCSINSHGFACGVRGKNGSSNTICGGGNIQGRWVHFAWQRDLESGNMEIFLDGQLVASGWGPAGDISYPDARVPTGNHCQGGPCVNSDPFAVLGAEKHDYDVVTHPPYIGRMDEVRFSTVLRYSSSGFTPSPRHTWDTNTVYLNQFDEKVNTGATSSGPIYEN